MPFARVFEGKKKKKAKTKRKYLGAMQRNEVATRYFTLLKGK